MQPLSSSILATFRRVLALDGVHLRNVKHWRSVESDCSAFLAALSLLFPRLAQRECAPHKRQKGSVSEDIRAVGEPCAHPTYPCHVAEIRDAEKGSVACWDQRLRTSKSSMLRVVSAKRVWLSLNWLNSSSS